MILKIWPASRRQKVLRWDLEPASSLLELTELITHFEQEQLLLLMVIVLVWWYFGVWYINIDIGAWVMGSSPSTCYCRWWLKVMLFSFCSQLTIQSRSSYCRLPWGVGRVKVGMASVLGHSSSESKVWKGGAADRERWGEQGQRGGEGGGGGGDVYGWDHCSRA